MFKFAITLLMHFPAGSADSLPVGTPDQTRFSPAHSHASLEDSTPASLLYCTEYRSCRHGAGRDCPAVLAMQRPVRTKCRNGKQTGSKDRSGNIAIWWRVNFALGGSAVHSAEVMTELDCVAGLGRDRAIVYFEQPGLAGGVKGFSIDNGWYALNKQRFEFLFKACSDHAPPAARRARAWRSRDGPV
jgi:hypothetical protein